MFDFKLILSQDIKKNIICVQQNEIEACLGLKEVWGRVAGPMFSLTDR